MANVVIPPPSHSIQAAVMKLFQLRKYPDLATDLPDLNEKLT